jgi:hypothetical protein
MNPRLRIVLILVPVGLALWLGEATLESDDGEAGAARWSKLESGPGISGNGSETAMLPGKASARAAAKLPATHAPRQLKDFFIPDVDIDGLPLREALEKMRAAYEKICLETGETPLALSFHLPSRNPKPLRVKLRSQTFTQSIRLLALLAGMKVKREGTDFHFAELSGDLPSGKRELQVPPDLKMRLAEFTGGSSEHDLRHLLASMGIEFDPSTAVEFDPSTAKLSIDAADGKDAAALTSLLNYLGSQSPIQVKLDAQVMEIPSGDDWKSPDLQSMDKAGLDALLADLAVRAGITGSALPSIVARNGEEATIEIIRELIMPKADNENEFETHNIGKTLLIEPQLVGLGTRMELNFRDVEANLDQDSGDVSVRNRTEIDGIEYAIDAFTRLSIQTRPDGSRTLVLLTSSRLDATGSPFVARE